MLLPTIDYNGGRRTYQDVSVVVEKITEERHWRNLWLKALKIMLRLEAPVIFKDDGDEVRHSEQIIFHNFAGEFSGLKVGDVLLTKIGYATKDEQRYNCVNPFSFSILKDGGMVQLTH